MKTILVLILAATLFSDSAVAAQVSFPTDSIIKNYEWCQAAGTADERLRRFDAFWVRYHPKDEQYGDAIEVTFVRLAAYRLVLLYAETGKLAKCAEFLAWLEAHDQAIPR